MYVLTYVLINSVLLKRTQEKWISTSITRVEACLDRTWETLNSGYWKDVPIEYRYCYSLCTVVKVYKYLCVCEELSLYIYFVLYIVYLYKTSLTCLSYIIYFYRQYC